MTKEQSFVRSKKNPGAVINTDNGGLLAYKRQKKQSKRIDHLENDVKDIKALLTSILEKLN